MCVYMLCVYECCVSRCMCVCLCMNIQRSFAEREDFCMHMNVVCVDVCVYVCV